MANKTINYESDFKIIEGFKDGSSILAAPFRFTYYTKVSRGVYVAEYNGSEFVNCIPTEDGKVIVPFDSPKLGMGVLMVKREFFLNDSNFNDGICNLVSVESTGITLDKGATDDLGEIDVLIEPFYHTINGGGYEPPVGGIPKTDLSEDVQSSLDKADTALQAEPVEGDSEEVEDYVLMKSDIKHIIPHVVEQTDSVVTIHPNVLNVWGEVASLDITLASPTDNTIVNEYMVQFTSGATATTLILPSIIKWMAAPNIQPNKTYQLSIINNLGVIGEFSHE